jgi:hypothetical protein
MMSVLGDRFKYDVFFSYAWGTSTGDPHLRDWCRAIADAVASMLRIRFNASGSFNAYLDRDESRSGQDLDVELKQAAERSGIFIAFISPFYSSDYCQKELAWFCDGNGLKGDALADRVCLLKVQDTPDDRWPDRFRGTSGQPLLYKGLCDDHGQPMSMMQFLLEKALRGMADKINEIVLEVADKISSMERRLRAQEQYIKAQAPPDKPVYFLEAEPKDQPRWAELNKFIRDVPSIVLPAAPKPATAICPDEDLKACDGMLMLRSRSDDNFSQRIQSAYLQRRELFRRPGEKTIPWIPWVLLDEVDPPPPEEAIYGIPRVKVEGDDWLEDVKQAMRC